MDELKRHVFDSLKVRIITQDLKPGERINEKEVMETYGIGKTPLREVFMNLQRLGLIKRFPRSGTIVAPIDIQELRNASQIRLLLEGLVAELAAERITAAQLAQFKELVDNLTPLAPATELETVVVYDTELHNLLYEVAANDTLTRMIQELQSIYSRFWFSLQFQLGDMQGHIDMWGAIYEALCRHDGQEVKRLLQEHIQDFLNRVKDIFF